MILATLWSSFHECVHGRYTGWSPPPYIIIASTSRPPDVTHVMDETRPSPFFTLFRFRVLNANRRTKTREAPGNEAIPIPLGVGDGGEGYFIEHCFLLRRAWEWGYVLLAFMTLTSLIPRHLCTGTQPLKLCRWGEPGIFSCISSVKGRETLIVHGCTRKLKLKKERTQRATY